MAATHDKASLRRAALARRDALAPTVRAEASRVIAEQALRVVLKINAAPIGLYWPIRSEVGTEPLIAALAGRGIALALPVVAEPALRFLAWAPGDQLVDAGFGTRGPRASAQEVMPRLLVVPLAAFDRAGHRVGYGKGHYDRAIARLTAEAPVATIGLAFACQEVEEIPVEEHDRRLDVIVTETETISGETKDREP
jgi:5-formyltetrahydrofolate cyclo-ligase